MSFSINTAPDIVPTGAGFLIKPGRPVTELRPMQASKILGISAAGVYKLLAMGLLECRRTPKNRIWISAESVQRHLENSMNPEFWDGRK
jgi:hypothetical protein